MKRRRIVLTAWQKDCRVRSVMRHGQKNVGLYDFVPWRPLAVSNTTALDGNSLMTDGLHHSHPDVIKRLKRAEGHLKNVIEMMAAGRPCVEVAQQLHAVEHAISAAKKALIYDHLDSCLEHGVGPVSRQQRAPIEEFKEITKYL